MGVEKIVERLQELLGSDSEKKRKKRVNEIKTLIEKLEKKKEKLDQKKKNASKSDSEKIERRLKVCMTQLKKGKEALEKIDK